MISIFVKSHLYSHALGLRLPSPPLRSVPRLYFISPPPLNVQRPQISNQLHAFNYMFCREVPIFMTLELELEQVDRPTQSLRPAILHSSLMLHSLLLIACSVVTAAGPPTVELASHLPPTPAGTLSPLPRPPFSWDTLPVFFHSANASGPWSDAAVKQIARFEMATNEKAHAMALPGGGRESEEVAGPAACRQVDAQKTGSHTFFYLNSVIDWPFNFKLHGLMVANPSWRLKVSGSREKLPLAFDILPHYSDATQQISTSTHKYQLFLLMLKHFLLIADYVVNLFLLLYLQLKEEA